MRRAVPLLLALLGLAGPALAQGVVVAPHAVYLDHRTRSASIVLYNPGAEPVEVSLGFRFGYPVTDSVGDFALYEPDPVDPALPAAHQWIDAFPRRMSLAPLQRQTVRLLARPPAGLPDGEYWARVVVSAKGGTVPVAGVADTAQIQIGLSLEVRTIIPLLYRKGVLETGVGVTALRASLAVDSLRIRARLIRQGRAAYVGTARGALLDQGGKTVARFDEPIAVYYEAEPSFALPIAGLPPGRYQVRLEFSNERADIAPELLLRTAVVRDSLAVTLP